MSLDPVPSGQTEVNDFDGNVTTLLWFSDLHDRLSIRTQATVETYLENPFNFLITDPECRSVPVAYPNTMVDFLAPYRSGNGGGISAPVKALVDDVLNLESKETVSFLTTLCREVHRRVTPVLRHEGPPYSPEESLSKGRGACRDLAVLFMEACRSVGLAARFVSGYHEVSQELSGEHLHAWAEVYLPGAGWRGFDPTSGFMVADRHVTVATGATPEHAAPTTGTFRGTGVEAEMAVELRVEGVAG